MLAARVVAGQFQRALDGLCAGVAVKEAMRPGHGRDGRELFGEIGQGFVVEVGAGDMDEFGGLLLNCGDDFRMAVAGGGDGDAGGEIEKLVAVNVFNAETAAALRDQGIRAGITGRNQPVVGGNRGTGLGSGHRTNQLRSKLCVHLLLGHLRVSSTSAVVRFLRGIQEGNAAQIPAERGSIN